MTELLQAIETFFNAASPDGSGLSASPFTGGLYLTQSPEGNPFPYCIGKIISATTTLAFGDTGYSEPIIQFTSWASDGQTALANMNAFTGAFDNQLLALANGKQNFFTARMGDPVPTANSPATDDQGNKAWGWSVSYKYGIR